MSLLRFDNVSKRYPGGHEALTEVGFEVDEGEMLFVTGHSGAGKSTLLRLINRLEEPSAGRILFRGRPVGGEGMPAQPGSGRQIGYVTQDDNLLPWRSVWDNVSCATLCTIRNRRGVPR